MASSHIAVNVPDDNRIKNPTSLVTSRHHLKPSTIMLNDTKIQ
jgi:hypothetical protein